MDEIASKLFFSKNDAKDPRLGDFAFSAKSVSERADLFILGYPDDEGIALNGGRVGAALAPDQIRHFFYRMTPPFGFNKNIALADLGNLPMTGTLKSRHENAKQLIKELCLASKPFISLGGGHDYGYADGAGFIAAQKEKSSSQKPLIVNFDAHLDVRSSEDGNSGTPFFRLIKEFGNEFELVEMGLQYHCNSPKHWQWALDHKVQLFPLQSLQERGLRESLTDLIEDFAKRPVFLSVDIDCFSYAYAPGCSQSWATGFDATEWFDVFGLILKKWQICGMGIYEVSPALDVGNQTSKLAAQIMHKFALNRDF